MKPSMPMSAVIREEGVGLMSVVSWFENRVVEAIPSHAKGVK